MGSITYRPDEFDTQVADMLVATPNGADPLVSPVVQEVLRMLRDKLGMDVVFVSQFSEGRRTLRLVDTRARPGPVRAGDSDPLEQSWCQRVVDGRLPQFIADAQPFVADGSAPDPGFPIGTHISTPVSLRGGAVFGTLCCFSFTQVAAANEEDLRRLQYTARLLAAKLDASDVCRALSAPRTPARSVRH